MPNVGKHYLTVATVHVIILLKVPTERQQKPHEGSWPNWNTPCHWEPQGQRQRGVVWTELLRSQIQHNMQSLLLAVVLRTPNSWITAGNAACARLLSALLLLKRYCENQIKLGYRTDETCEL
jgi:hypothetical protein